jgi:hypothetical protein
MSYEHGSRGEDVSLLGAKIGEITLQSNEILAAKMQRQLEMETIFFPNIQQQAKSFALQMQTASMPIDRVWAEYSRTVERKTFLGTSSKTESIMVSLPMWLVATEHDLANNHYSSGANSNTHLPTTSAVALSVDGNFMIVNREPNKAFFMANSHPTDIKELFGEYLEDNTPLESYAKGVSKMLLQAATDYANENRRTDILTDKRYDALQQFTNAPIDLTGWKAKK